MSQRYGDSETPMEPMFVFAENYGKPAEKKKTATGKTLPTKMALARKSETTKCQVTPAKTMKILTMSKEEVKQIVHETISNHPKIRAIDEKLTRLLRITEKNHSYEQNKMEYFPIKDTKTITHLEEVLDKNPRERAKVVSRINFAIT
jgi:hypothetical protein